MMKQEIFDRIKNDHDFIQLVRARSRFAWTLTIVMLFIYFGFILLIAFNPAFLATPLAQGRVTTIAIPLGLGVIVSAFVLTGVYVWRANGKFDALTQKIKDNVKETA